EVSVHPGRVQQRFVDELRATAAATLPPAMAEVVQATEQPYVQTVMDVRVPHMAIGRAALIGDGAFGARPHAPTRPLERPRPRRTPGRSTTTWPRATATSLPPSGPGSPTS